MEERITLCGDNCIECPRYNAHTEVELRKVAELWYGVGWRETVVSNEEIVCAGGSSHKSCTYGLVACTEKHGVEKCNQCKDKAIPIAKGRIRALEHTGFCLSEESLIGHDGTKYNSYYVREV